MFIQTLHVKDERSEFVEVSVVEVYMNGDEKRVKGYTNSLDKYNEFDDTDGDIGKPWMIDMDYNEFFYLDDEGLGDDVDSIDVYELDIEGWAGKFTFDEKVELCKHYVETMTIALEKASLLL